MKKHRLFFIIASIIFIAFYLFDHFAYEYYLRNFDVFFSNFYRFTVFSRPLILITLWYDHLYLVFKRK